MTDDAKFGSRGKAECSSLGNLKEALGERMGDHRLREVLRTAKGV